MADTEVFGSEGFAEPELTDGPIVDTPCRRLRVAVLLRALLDVEEGGRLRKDALAWLLDTGSRGEEGLRARDLFEEIGLDPDLCQRALRRGRGAALRRIAAAVDALPVLDFAAVA
jgi:hypothetical protein